MIVGLLVCIKVYYSFEIEVALSSRSAVELLFTSN